MTIPEIQLKQPHHQPLIQLINAHLLEEILGFIPDASWNAGGFVTVFRDIWVFPLMVVSTNHPMIIIIKTETNSFGGTSFLDKPKFPNSNMGDMLWISRKNPRTNRSKVNPGTKFAGLGFLTLSYSWLPY